MSDVRVYVMQCGTCGHVVSALDEDRMKAAALDHLRHLHSPELVSHSEEANNV